MRIIFQRPASAHRRLNSCQFDLSNYKNLQIFDVSSSTYHLRHLIECSRSTLRLTDSDGEFVATLVRFRKGPLAAASRDWTEGAL